MNDNQLYSLVSIYAQSGNLAAVIDECCRQFPEYEKQIRIFLTAYDHHCTGKLNRPGNGYVDVQAFKKACAIMKGK